MSIVKIISTEVNDLPPLATPKRSREVSSSGRVDINHLLARVRKEKNKENKISFIIFCGLFSIIVIVGAILSF